MQSQSYLENDRRGTPDFPVELYRVNSNHPRYHMQFHWHNDIEFIHVSKGALHLKLNDAQYTLLSGESMIIPSGIVHGGIPENCEYECIVFSRSILYATAGIKQSVKNELIYPVKFTDNPSAEKLFSILINSHGEHFDFISNLYKVVGEAVKRQSGPKTFSQEKIERIKPALVYIEDNYNSHITTSDLARECLMSNNYFIKYFKEVTSQTPIEFLNKYRIEVACEMLISGHSVTDVAFACGYNDLSYFIHIFKKEMGISPKKYSAR